MKEAAGEANMTVITIVLIAIVLGAGTLIVTNSVFSNNHSGAYGGAISNVGNLTIAECKFANNSSIDCPKEKSDGFYRITLQELVNNGFLKGNSTYTEGDENQKNTFTIVNPKNNALIDECVIEYKYENGNIIVEAVEPTGSCPKNY